MISSLFSGTNRFSILPAAALFIAANFTYAGEVKVTSAPTITPVVELYTSEGCSSCPPADKWVSKLGDTINADFHAVPLAFHVDYWNRLGWPDPFSKKAYTERQKQLAIQNRQSSIYTPEFLVSGEETRGTNRVVRAIAEANEELAQVMITYGVRSEDNRLVAEMLINNPVKDAPLFLVIYENNIVREIGAGENKGRTLHHDFVVRHWQQVDTLPVGSYEKEHLIEVGDDWNQENLGFAVVVLDPKNGATLQALRTPLESVFTKS
ncbi:MAG: DUF1223 domain-containing protein [Acidiferrobacterales bacterium]|nr:DUF1223 domain-containing protein [Acidiferrobacterales bacterium]